MKSLVVLSALVFCVAMATAQGPQAPPVTPMKFAYYPATEVENPGEYAERRRPDQVPAAAIAAITISRA